MNYKKDNFRNSLFRGFSLVELAISIVVIALLLAGVSGYGTLVRQSEIRSVIADLQNYKSVYQGFKKQYRQPPGDMINATDYWSTGCADTITCNGNGNGTVEAIWNSSADETARAWKHLSLSGYFASDIEELPSSYTGNLTTGNFSPLGKIDNSSYYIAGGDDIGGRLTGTIVASPWDDDLTNALFIGQLNYAEADYNGLTSGIISGIEAWSIDSKMDDGTPSGGGNDTGKIRTIQDEYGGSTCISGGAYNLQSDATSCVLGFQLDDRN
jgi:prepilin-type N-terminal cleavage/methylation domain-containing protein